MSTLYSNEEIREASAAEVSQATAVEVERIRDQRIRESAEGCADSYMCAKDYLDRMLVIARKYSSRGGEKHADEFRAELTTMGLEFQGMGVVQVRDVLVPTMLEILEASNSSDAIKSWTSRQIKLLDECSCDPYDDEQGEGA